jgi:hypothetical protein
MTLKDSHYLPIPYPRYMSYMTNDGLIDNYPKDKNATPFVQQMPSLTKLNLDGSYLGTIEKMYKGLRNLNLATRSQLLKNNDHMELDEYREKVENLKILMEEYKTIALGEEPDSGSSEGNDVDDDY